MSNKREAYEKALATIHHLILLGERHIPAGPPNAYGILEDIMSYVNTLEFEYVKLLGACQHMGGMSQGIPIGAQLGGALQIDPATRNALEEAKIKAKIYNEEKQKHHEEFERASRLFPKVSL